MESAQQTLDPRSMGDVTVLPFAQTADADLDLRVVCRKGDIQAGVVRGLIMVEHSVGRVRDRFGQLGGLRSRKLTYAAIRS